MAVNCSRKEASKLLEERGYDINSLPREVRTIDPLIGDDIWTTQ
jgi:hypothetical protein